MATKFTMLPPFDQASGNVSGKQTLKYALHNNPAYDAPVGKVNYARNYRTRYVAGIKSATGEGYIQVKKKTAVHLTERAKLNMALLGGTGAIFGAIVANKSSELYANLYAQWVELQNYGSKKTFRQSVSDAIRLGLQQKLAQIPYAGPRGVVNITNPWNYTGDTPNVTINSSILVKFWTELAANPVTFTVAGLVGVAHSGETFSLIMGSNHNVLSLAFDDVTVGGSTVSNAVYIGSVGATEVQVLSLNNQIAVSTDTPTKGSSYELLAGTIQGG